MINISGGDTRISENDNLIWFAFEEFVCEVSSWWKDMFGNSFN